MGVEEDIPKTILEEIVDQTIQKIKDDPEFDEEKVYKLEGALKSGKINPDDLILILKGVPE